MREHRCEAATEAAELHAQLVGLRGLARAVFARDGVIVDDDHGLDAELIDIANKAGGSLLRCLRGEEDALSYAALGDVLNLAAALRAVLGYSPTPGPRELTDAEYAAAVLRPEHCPGCREVGLCRTDCETAAVHGWPREITPEAVDA